MIGLVWCVVFLRVCGRLWNVSEVRKSKKSFGGGGGEGGEEKIIKNTV